MRSASSTAATVDMEHRQARASPSALPQRVASALVLGPLALVAIWLGPPTVDALIVAAAALMGWEWGRLSGLKDGWRGGVLAAFVTAASVVVAAAWSVTAALGLLAATAVLLALVAPAVRGHRLGWLAVGVLYIGLPSVALAWIAADREMGRATLFWLVALVWATDTGAYFAGRTIGGRKLAPAISPGKTWAGLLGGIAAAAAVGVATALWTGASPVVLVLVSAMLAVVEQAGDLLESAFKRHFKVKDSGHLIPGHGGMLDRLDGLLMAALAVALIVWIGGESVLKWR